MTDQICIRCKRVMDHSDSLSICPTCDAQDADILAREDRVSFFNAVSLAMKHDRRLFTPDESDDEDEVTEDTDEDYDRMMDAYDHKIASEEIASLANPDGLGQIDLDDYRARVGLPLVKGDDVPDADPDTLFEDMIEDITTGWTETRAILVRDPDTGGITVHPNDSALLDEDTFVDEVLPGDEDEAASAVMFLTFEQAEFMERVCRFDGMLVYLHQTAAIRMALDLEAGGLVTIDRTPVFWVVSAVRG